MIIYEVIRTWRDNNTIYKEIIAHFDNKELAVIDKNLRNKNADKSIYEYYFVNVNES